LSSVHSSRKDGGFVWRVLLGAAVTKPRVDCQAANLIFTHPAPNHKPWENKKNWAVALSWKAFEASFIEVF
jgi:hypothetical protein